MTTDDPSIAVVYLARCAEGAEPIERFLDSYRRYPAGIDHQLVVIFKGYDRQVALDAARTLFAGTAHLGVVLDDSGFDIGSYLETARRIPHAYLCCLNTFTEIAAPDWLALLNKRVTQERIGIVGAMGSYESQYDSNRLLHKVTWLCEHGVPYDPSFHYFFQFIVERHCRDWCTQGRLRLTDPTPVMFDAPPVPRRPTLAQTMRRRWLDARFSAHLRNLKHGSKPPPVWMAYPPFPNVHIRSNGFMVRREQLLPFERGQIRNKEDAYEFENGANSLTAQLRRAGLRTLIVGRDDREFDVVDWPRSGTYRLGEQPNLLLHDNQSRGFAAAAAGSRQTLARLTWGDYLAPPLDFPDLRLNFPRQPL